jgi:hypothetical protein
MCRKQEVGAGLSHPLPYIANPNYETSDSSSHLVNAPTRRRRFIQSFINPVVPWVAPAIPVHQLELNSCLRLRQPTHRLIGDWAIGRQRDRLVYLPILDPLLVQTEQT